jgi:uncharacterized membrane protein YbhN (UPF0104 family)
MQRAIFLLLKAAVSGLLLYFALRVVDLTAVRERLVRVDARWIALILPILLAQTGLLALRWQKILVHCGATLSFRPAFRFSMIAQFFNQTLPSSIGGDAMRIWLVSQHANWRSAIYSVFLDRVIGVVSLAVLVLVCLPWTLELVRNPIGRAALLLIGLGCLGAGTAFVALAWQRLRVLQRWSFTRHLVELAGVALAILRSPRSFVPAFGISVLVHLLTALTAWCAARAIQADVPLLYTVFLVPPVILVTVVPISIAGWGVREGAMVAAFGYAGLSPGDGLIVSLLFGAGYLVMGAVGGLIWVATSDRREHANQAPRAP